MGEEVGCYSIDGCWTLHHVPSMNIKLATVLLFTVTVSLADKLPFELERLKNQRDRKIEEINKVYKRQLELLKVKYTKAGNLDAANQVVAIIQNLSPTKEKETPRIVRPKDVAELKLYLAQNTWTHDGGKSVWTFYEDGTFGLGSEKGNRFVVTDKNTLTMLWGGKGTKGINCQFSDDFSKFFELHGAKATYRLIKR